MNDIGNTVVKLQFEKIPCYITGTGDLLCALFVGWYTKSDGDLKLSCENVVNTIHSDIQKTSQHAVKQENAFERAENYEMRLIQSRNIIEKPEKTIKATEIIR